jgi:hypothetical protein
MYFVIGTPHSSNRDRIEAAMPKLKTIAELGVLRGDHAEKMFAYHGPDSMHLVDTWSAETYRNQEKSLPYVKGFESLAFYFGGNPFDQAVWDNIYQLMESKFAQNPKVKIVREETHRAAAIYKDQFFDLVYIDAGHPYNSVLRDLFSWQAKIKPDGFIVLNDCSASPETRSQNGGVLEAATTFIKATDFRPLALSSDIWADLVLSRQPASANAWHLQRELVIQNSSGIIELPDEALFSFNHKHIANPQNAETPIILPSFGL